MITRPTRLGVSTASNVPFHVSCVFSVSLCVIWYIFGCISLSACSVSLACVPPLEGHCFQKHFYKLNHTHFSSDYEVTFVIPCPCITICPAHIFLWNVWSWLSLRLPAASWVLQLEVHRDRPPSLDSCFCSCLLFPLSPPLHPSLCRSFFSLFIPPFSLLCRGQGQTKAVKYLENGRRTITTVTHVFLYMSVNFQSVAHLIVCWTVIVWGNNAVSKHRHLSLVKIPLATSWP